MDGIINLNKPSGMTSHRCVSAMRKILGIKRIGHTGTLDPQTSGVLPICIGSATRIMEYLDLDFKKYRAELTLGLVTETQDIWGEVIVDFRDEMRKYNVTREGIMSAFAEYIGRVEQIPPKYSAIKVNGRRLYEYARVGEDVEIKKRTIFIKDMTINEIDMETYKVSFDVECSKGTYVRTICHDIGKALGCGGTMSSLVRLASGIFTIEDAVSLDELVELAQTAELSRLNLDGVLTHEQIRKFLKPADYPLVHFGKAVIKERERADWFVNGGHIALNEVVIEREPEYASKEPPFEIRDEYKRAYNLYGDIDGKETFLGVVFYNTQYKKLVADKVFYRRGNHETI